MVYIKRTVSILIHFSNGNLKVNLFLRQEKTLGIESVLTEEYLKYYSH